jgi:hypothetical protein
MHFNQNKKNLEKQKHIKDTKAWAKEMGALMFESLTKERMLSARGPPRLCRVPCIFYTTINNMLFACLNFAHRKRG